MVRSGLKWVEMERMWRGVLVTMLMGQYEHTLDAKGRINVPAKFRDELGESIF